MAHKLADVFQELNFGVGKAIKACKLLTLWPQVVDERVAKNTEALKISCKTLYIKTKSPAWANELNFLKQDLIDKFNLLAGEKVLNDIRFKA